MGAQFWNEEVFGKKREDKDVDMDVSKLKGLPGSEIENGLVLPPDVEAEHTRIIKALESNDYETDALRVVNMHKIFMGSGKTPAKTAVRSVSLESSRVSALVYLGITVPEKPLLSI